MKTSIKKLAVVLATTMFASTALEALAAEGNDKRGRVYYKMVCTACHLSQSGEVISPSKFTMAEWKAYIDADKHDKTGATNPSLKYYVSKEYRESIADSNKAAKKFLKLPADQLHADIRAFAIGGAKDSDTPASCE